MIEIRLNDNSYEQDIRELLMAFYPGEGFVYGAVKPDRSGVTDERPAVQSAAHSAAVQVHCAAAQEIPTPVSGHRDGMVKEKPSLLAVSPDIRLTVEGLVSDNRRSFRLRERVHFPGLR